MATANLAYILTKRLAAFGCSCMFGLAHAAQEILLAPAWVVEASLAVLNTQESTSVVWVGPINMERILAIGTVESSKPRVFRCDFRSFVKSSCWSFLPSFIGCVDPKKCSCGHSAPSPWMASNIGLVGCKAQRTLSPMWLQTLTLTFFAPTRFRTFVLPTCPSTLRKDHLQRHWGENSYALPILGAKETRDGLCTLGLSQA